MLEHATHRSIASIRRRLYSVGSASLKQPRGEQLDGFPAVSLPPVSFLVEDYADLEHPGWKGLLRASPSSDLSD